MLVLFRKLLEFGHDVRQMLRLGHEDLLEQLILECLFFLFLESKHTFEQKGVVFGSEIVEIGQEGDFKKAEVRQHFQEVVVVVEIVLDPLLLLPLVVSQRIDILLPLGDELDHIESELRQMVEAVRKQF